MPQLWLILILKLNTENILVSNNFATRFDALTIGLSDSDSHTRVMSYLITRALLRRLSGEHQINAAHKILDNIGLQALATVDYSTLVKDDESFEVGIFITYISFVGLIKQ